MQKVLELKNITKSFNKMKVLNNISFSLYSNEIIAILGDNGAGKSTLIKTLSGLVHADSGEMLVNSKKIDIKKYSISQARENGIESVYQDNSLGLEQEIHRNIFLGREITNIFGFIDINKQKIESMKLLKGFLGLKGLGLSSSSQVSSLSGGERQGLVIARAVYFDAKLVILDEPTRSLAIKEVKKVLDFIKELKNHNKSAIFITHNILHAYEVCSRFILIDRGEIKADINKSDISVQDLQNKLINIESL